MSNKLQDTYSEESDFFQITRGSDRYIHINHYYYYADCEVEQGKPYRRITFSKCIVPLSEFLAIPAKERQEYVNGLQCNVTQYIDDLTEVEYFLALDYDEAHLSPKHLQYSQITSDTPSGWYYS